MESYQFTTLTVNPSLDKSTHFTGLVAEQKIRCEKPHYDAGGGGINVSKAIAELGGSSLCIYTSGGPTGKMLEELMQRERIENRVIPIKNWTRENFIAFENSSRAQYRFGFPGDQLFDDEKKAIIDAIKEIQTSYLIISGSLNEGLPADFYQEISEAAKALGAKIIVDVSGEALQKVIATGVYLMKPNIGELAKLVGVERLEKSEVEKAAKTFIEKRNAEIITVSLGAEGAFLVTKDQSEFIAAPKAEKKSTVGAGDSMVGGMVWALSQNKTLKEVIQWGVACGTAATLNDGTRLFKKEDAIQLYEEMSNKKP